MDNLYVTKVIGMFAEGKTEPAILHIIISAVILVLTIITAKLVISKTPGYEKGKKRYTFSLAAVSVVAMLMIGKYGILNVAVYKGIVFTLIMLYASLCDIYERKVANFVSIEILILGFIETSVKTLAVNALAGIAFFIFMFVTAMIANGKLGGADFKITAASAFVLGFKRSISGMIIGLLLSVIITLIIKKVRKTKDNSLPLVPYLATGFLSSYIFL